MNPPIYLLINFIFLLTTHFSTVTSQTEVYDCSNEHNYTSESVYRANLKSLLRSISSNIDNSGFKSASMGPVNAIVLCRGDTQPNVCTGCVDIAADAILWNCPTQKEAIRWAELCMLRYSDKPFLGIPATSPVRIWENPDYATSPNEFRAILRTLMEDLRRQAANGSALRKVAARSTNNTTAYNQTIYGMVQCTPDLSAGNCTSCLVQAERICLNLSYTKIGMRVYTPSCIMRYENYTFFNTTRLEQPLERPSPSRGIQQPLEPPSSPSPGKKDDNITGDIIINIIIVISSLIGLTLALCVGICTIRRIKRKAKENPNIDDVSTIESIQYDFGQIRVATDDFSDANKLGQGGFGAVYKGKLENGREIAVKRLSKDSGQGDLEFKNEVLLVARLQHRNLVRLLGFSIEGSERLLVYEFHQNGSLDHFLFDPVKSSNLDWERRYKIIGGIAKGLLYLHEDSRLRIIHRDLKASNVLLDEEMNPKIADFGMAKLIMPDVTQESTSRVVGTHGYIAPEYATHGHVSIKSDVYSFGVLVLEIISGQKKAHFHNGGNPENFLSYFWRSWRDGSITNLIDPVLRAISGSQLDMQRCIHIALLCVQENATDRPTMASVVLMLNSFSTTLPLPSEPAFYVPSSFSETALLLHEYNSKEKSSSSSKNRLIQATCAPKNGISITELYPR